MSSKSSSIAADVKALRRKGMSFGKIAKTFHIPKSKAYRLGRDVKVEGEGEVDPVKALSAELKECRRARKEKEHELEAQMEKNKDLEAKLKRLDRKKYGLGEDANNIGGLHSLLERLKSDADFHREEADKFKERFKEKSAAYMRLGIDWETTLKERVNSRLAGVRARIVEISKDLDKSMRKLEREPKPVLSFWRLLKRVKYLDEVNSILIYKLSDTVLQLQSLASEL